MIMSCRVEAASLAMQQMYSMSTVLDIAVIVDSRCQMPWLQVFVRSRVQRSRWTWDVYECVQGMMFRFTK